MEEANLKLKQKELLLKFQENLRKVSQKNLLLILLITKLEQNQNNRYLSLPMLQMEFLLLKIFQIWNIRNRMKSEIQFQKVRK